LDERKDTEHLIAALVCGREVPVVDDPYNIIVNDEKMSRLPSSMNIASIKRTI
jgi:hypothetical protein